MKIYDKLHSFSCDKEMKEFLLQMKRNKVNVSKFIRDSIKKNMPEIKQDRRKKSSLSDLKESFAIFEENLTKKH